MRRSFGLGHRKLEANDAPYRELKETVSFSFICSSYSSLTFLGVRRTTPDDIAFEVEISAFTFFSFLRPINEVTKCVNSNLKCF